MEEISWGQRLLGYRPPAYFLENNAQQELNLHNLGDNAGGKAFRKLALVCVLVAYGLVLPAATLRSRGRRILRALGIVAPPLAVVPIFAIATVAYLAYPVKLTGEWVELLLGVGLLAAACLSAPRRRRLRSVAVASIGVAALALASAAWSLHLRTASPAAVETARAELEALARAVGTAGIDGAESRHVRLRTYVDGGPDRISQSAVDALAAVAGDRAEFFLDPWNMPYWIRLRRDDGGPRAAILYSFGPNRVRESIRWDPLGDDVGAEIHPTE